MSLQFALCLLLPLAILAQVWFTNQVDARPRGIKFAIMSWPTERYKAPLLALALCLVVAATEGSGIWAERSFLFDDSFISYRYAQNLADGYGLVWNPGGPHTEGYTNLLLILIVAPLLHIGANPLTVVRIVSLLCSLAMAGLVYEQARRFGATRAIALILGLGIYTFSFTAELIMLGLETVMFSCALLAAFAFSERYFATDDRRWMVLAGFVSFLAFLLRPEVVFLVAAISLAALLSPGRSLRGWVRLNSLLLLGFALPVVLYLAWKLWYFGSVIPNPALVKLPGNHFLSPRGIGSVGAFLDSHSKILLLAGFGLLFPAGRYRSMLTCALVVVMYVLFYLRVDTLMDYAQRFLYPAFPFLLILSLPVLKKFVEAVLNWRQVPLIQMTAGGLFFIALFYQYPTASIGRVLGHPGILGRVEDREIHQASQVLERIGTTLASYDHIKDVRLGSTDAGLLPFFSGIQHVDMAGLNTRYLAEHHDVNEAATYFFAQNLDLIIVRARIGGTLVDYEHGVLGDYPKWAHHPGWNQFVGAGAIHNGPRHDLYFFLRKDSPHRAALEKLISERLNQPDVTPLQASLGTN